VKRVVFALALTAALGCSRDVRIGCVISSTGAASTLGDQVRKGMDLALEVETDSGDLPGSVSLFYRDDATNPEVGVRALEELVSEEHVPFVIGAVSSPVTLALATACERRRIVLLSPTASAPEISAAGDWVFRIHPSDAAEAVSMADFAKDVGFHRLAVAAVEDRYGQSLRDAFVARVGAGGMDLAGVAMFAEGDAEDMDRAVRAVAAMSPDAVYLAAYAADSITVSRKLREQGCDARVLGTSALNEGFVREAGAAADGTVFPGSSFRVDESDPAVSRFVERYRERYGEDPDVWAAHGYDAMRVALRAFRDAKRWRPEALRESLAAIDDYDGAAGPTAFDANGDVMRYPRLLVVRGGETIPYDRFVAEGGMLAVSGR
jgi:branched-chain amino acid transport system substrate-binding protein